MLPRHGARWQALAGVAACCACIVVFVTLRTSDFSPSLRTSETPSTLLQSKTTAATHHAIHRALMPHGVRKGLHATSLAVEPTDESSKWKAFLASRAYRTQDAFSRAKEVLGHCMQGCEAEIYESPPKPPQSMKAEKKHDCIDACLKKKGVQLEPRTFDDEAKSRKFKTDWKLPSDTQESKTKSYVPTKAFMPRVFGQGGFEE